MEQRRFGSAGPTLPVIGQGTWNMDGDAEAAVAALLQKGKILSWGVSNFDVADLEEVSKIKTPACNQVLYHLKERAIEHAVIPWCEQHGVAVVAYSPFGSGDFPKSKVLDEIG